MLEVNRLSEIRFEAGKDFRYIPSTRTVIYDGAQVKSRRGVQQLMHEYSHALLGHTVRTDENEQAANRLASVLFDQLAA